MQQGRSPLRLSPVFSATARRPKRAAEGRAFTSAGIIAGLVAATSSVLVETCAGLQARPIALGDHCATNLRDSVCGVVTSVAAKRVRGVRGVDDRGTPHTRGGAKDLSIIIRLWLVLGHGLRRRRCQSWTETKDRTSWRGLAPDTRALPLWIASEAASGTLDVRKS